MYHNSCSLLFPGAAGTNLEAGLPAAPAAMRLIHTAFRTCSRLQQLAGREGSPAPLLLLAADKTFQGDCRFTSRMLYWALYDIAGAMYAENVTGALQSLPGACELLLCPELVPCLAITVLVGLLGLTTRKQKAAGRGSGNKGAVGSASGSSSSSASLGSSAGDGAGGSSGSSSGRGMLTSQTQEHMQQPATPAATISTAGSSTSSSSSSVTRTARLPNGISLDSLTPLSRGLFSLLGVDEDVLLEVARGTSDNWSGAIQFSSDNHSCIVDVWCLMLDYQVQYWLSPSFTCRKSHVVRTAACRAVG